MKIPVKSARFMFPSNKCPFSVLRLKALIKMQIDKYKRKTLKISGKKQATVRIDLAKSANTKTAIQTIPMTMETISNNLLEYQANRIINFSGFVDAKKCEAVRITL
jgi:hypothetical protein